MKGIQIFSHSVRQVFGNLGPALRVSGALYLAQIALVLVLGLSVIADQAGMQARIEAGDFPWGRFLLLIVAVTIASLWIAVGWHRYVLRVEEAGMVPAWHGDRMLAYFGNSILLALISIPIILVIGIVAGIALGPLLMNGNSMVLLLPVLLVFYLPLVIVLYRLGPVLPAAALGEPLGISQAWRATASDLGTFIGLAAVTLAASFVIDIPVIWVFPEGSALSILWQVITGWVKLMVGISILTTLYGHYVEKRTLV